ncbi:ATP-binding protein [Actinoallomurus rhizosphaericola]|uniref:ATP-binding protein n=1 Tax=Actinoallomurus rhizosphaericola TaxID=2952536 RepID=UPI002092AA9E|nr:LuxR C-terminal-related transcriptional regulator [Actinoallomurus rhizosphaericola]MCO5997374.1 LuxR C-terminal-related transcriptional regulator [Actinoallomurus rhizosphaericola]
MTSFVGRRHELAEAKRLLSVGRLVTLTGSGGVGKTRLAARVAAEMRREFPDGAWLVDLAPVASGESLTQVVAGVLGFQDQTSLQMLGDHLANRRLLLLLDNCEHLTADAAALVGSLLPFAPGLRVLATSRQVLHAEGEHVLEVPPLSVPDRDEVAPGDAATRFEAVSLFAERASAVVPDFVVDAENSVAVMRLCRRLDGIPLAIELAAVRLRALSVRQILDRLDDRFRILVGRNPTAVPRQQTLRALIDWSYDMCTPQERAVWEALSVFSGGCSLEAAVCVCSADDLSPEDVVDIVTALVDKSILLRRDRERRAPRYEMLESLREYGRERLAASGRETVMRRRHAAWCHEVAAEAQRRCFGPDQMEVVTWIRAEQPNITSALEFCLTEGGEAHCALEIATCMWSHRLSWTSLSDGHRWLERGLALDRAPTALRAKALWVDAWLMLLCGDPAAAEPLLEQSRALAEQLDDDEQRAGVTQVSGFAALLAGDFARASALLEKALEYYRAVGYRNRIWVSLFQLTMAAVFGDDPRSAALCRECRKMCEENGATWTLSYALWITGVDRWRRGEPEAGMAIISDALRLKDSPGDHLGVAECVEALAWLKADARQYTHAAELLGAAGGIWRSIGTSLSGLGHLAGPHARCEERLRTALGDEAFTAAYGTGSRLGVEGAIAHALGAEAAGGFEDPGVASALTPREREIAELVAQGLSNKEIANTLVIAQRTAEGHVEHILRKLGFTSRAQIAATWSARKEAGARPEEVGVRPEETGVRPEHRGGRRAGTRARGAAGGRPAGPLTGRRRA